MAADDLRLPGPDDLHDPYAAEIGERLRASYAAQPAQAAAHAARVTARVLASAPPSKASSAPSGVRARWWWGAAAAAVLMVVVARPWRPDVHQREADSALAEGGARPRASGHATVAAPAPDANGTVRFTFSVPQAAQAVALVGDFNGWDTAATPMVQQGPNGTWTAQVPLEPGRHEYAFVVNGQQWLVDPLAPQVENAGFGPTNAVVVRPRDGQ